jgi:aminopeptidase N
MRLILFVLLLLPSLAIAAPLHPEGRNVVGLDRRVDVQRLELDLAVDVLAGTLEGTATHTVRPLRQGLKEIVFHQVALDVQSVTVDGAEVAFTLEPSTIRIALPAPSSIDAIHTIVTRYRAAPTNGLHFRHAPPLGNDAYDEVWSQGEATDNRYWFPGWDAPDDRFTFAMKASAEDRFTVVSNGTLRSKGADPTRPGWTRWHWEIGGGDIVNYLVALAVAEYERGEASWRGRPVMAFTPPGTDPTHSAATVAATAEMLDVFSELTGIEYPYDAYNQIFVQRFLYTGMENAAATIMDRRLIHPPDHDAHRRYSDRIIAHELAHQWFGDQLTCRTWREMWLNEGFATFFGSMWTEHANGPVAGAGAVLGRYNGQLKADKGTARPLVVDYFNRPEDGRGSNPYGKGAAVLQMARVLLGEDAFWRGIRAYTRDNQHGNVETADLRRAFEGASGLHLDWFFDQWVFSPGHPELTVTAKADAEAGTVRIGLKQTQNKDWQTFTLPVDVEVATAKGTAVHRIWMDARDGGGLAPLAGDLLYVAPDPRGGLLAKITLKQGPKAWTTLLQQSPHPYAKLWALQSLRDVKPDDALRAVVHGLVRERSTERTYRRAAAELLGHWAQEGDFDVLVATLDGEADEGMRESILKALHTSMPRPVVIDAVVDVVQSDPIPWLRGVAIGTLAKVEGEDVRRRLFPLIRSPSDAQHTVQRAAARALGTHGRVTDIGALDVLRSPKTTHIARMSAWDATLALLKKAPVADRDALRRPLAREADKMLEDLHLRVRQKASHLLRTVGDEKSIAALKALKGREDVESLRESIDKTIEAIRTRKDTEPDATDGELKAKMKALEERLDEAEKELREVQERY